MIPLRNGKDIKLDRVISEDPDVSGAITSYFRPLVFGRVQKSIDNFEIEESVVPLNLYGRTQPLSPQKLMMKPEGQRSWKWLMVQSLPDPQLKTDDTLVYLGEQFRVMEKIDYSNNGYVEYHIANDYKGAGP